MKKFVLALSALAALAAGPAMARSDTHISVGFYSPAPVYYTPVAHYSPVRYVYHAPRPCHKHHARHGRGHGRGHERHYESAWNEPRGDYGHDHGWSGHH